MTKIRQSKDHSAIIRAQPEPNKLDDRPDPQCTKHKGYM